MPIENGYSASTFFEQVFYKHLMNADISDYDGYFDFKGYGGPLRDDQVVYEPVYEEVDGHLVQIGVDETRWEIVNPSNPTFAFGAGELATRQNDGTGRVAFSRTYSEADAGKVFFYRIWEIDESDYAKNAEERITYDAEEELFAVRVYDNGDGTMGTQVKFLSGDHTFRNIAPLKFPDAGASAGGIISAVGMSLLAAGIVISATRRRRDKNPLGR